MADMSVDTLIFELIALAPELEGAQELEDIIYTKLQETAEAEKDMIKAEVKRLRSAAKERRTLQDNDMTMPALTAVMRETNKLALKLIALGNAYKGPKADEIRCMVRQLPRAVKAERAPAEAVVKRLQAELAALKATGAVTPTTSTKIEDDEDPDGPRPSPHAEHASHSQQGASAGRPGLPGKASSGRHTKVQTSEPATAANGDNGERENGNLRYSAATKRKASPSPSATRSDGGTSTRSRNAFKTDHSIAHHPVSTPEFTFRKQPTLHAGTDSPLLDERSLSICRDSRSRVRNHDDRQPICGSCMFHRRNCNGMPQCNECSHKLCVYHACEFGDTCALADCTRIHPVQMESASKGEEYLVQGLNVHTKAPVRSGSGKKEHRQRRSTPPREY